MRAEYRQKTSWEEGQSSRALLALKKRAFSNRRAVTASDSWRSASPDYRSLHKLRVAPRYCISHHARTISPGKASFTCKAGRSLLFVAQDQLLHALAIHANKRRQFSIYHCLILLQLVPTLYKVTYSSIWRSPLAKQFSLSYSQDTLNQNNHQHLTCGAPHSRS